MKMMVVVVKKNSNSPEHAWEGCPDMFSPHKEQINISCVFTWDKPKAEMIADAWRDWGCKVQIGGPAYDDPGGEFTPGLYTKQGITITHRGCVRQCSWCYVPKREGYRIREIEIKEGNVLQDNNILACSRRHQEKVFDMLSKQRKVRLLGGLDVRLLTDWAVDRIKGLRLYDLWIAADSLSYRKHYLKAIKKLSQAGIPRYKLRCYVLVAFGNETQDQAEERLREVFIEGALPFAQFYDQSTQDYNDWRKLVKRWSRPAATKAWMKTIGKELA